MNEIPWVPLEELEALVAAPGVSVVVFSLENCAPCKVIYANLQEAAPSHVRLYVADKRRLSPALAKKWYVGYPPRTIFFKDGEAVGRFYGGKTVPELTALFAELAATGRVLSDRTDGEEECRFRDKVLAALAWEWKTDREAKADKFLVIADKIFDENDNWSVLTVEQIKQLLGDAHEKRNS